MALMNRLLASLQTLGPITREEMYNTMQPMYHTSERRKYGYQFFTDFLSSGAPDPLVAVVSGTGAALSAGNSTNERPGVLDLATGTTTTGRATALTGATAVHLGNGDWVYEADINIATLADGTESYGISVGFFDDTTGATPVDGAYVYYSNAGANWLCRTVSNSTQTETNSAVAVTTGWHRIRIETDDTATVKFYIDGALVATHTANIPTGASRYTGFGLSINKSAGTTSRSLQCDCLAVHWNTPDTVRR